jgi:hypothetical protein
VINFIKERWMEKNWRRDDVEGTLPGLEREKEVWVVLK